MVSTSSPKGEREMRVSIIAPTSMLRTYCTTGIQYCLPRLFLEDRAYRHFYLERHKAGDLIILDCTKPEWKRQPASLESVRAVVARLYPQLIILPSHMYFWSKTVQVAREYMKELPNVELVACLEGASRLQINQCMRAIKNVHSYALPSHIYGVCKTVKWDKPIIYIDNHIQLEDLGGIEDILITSLPIRLGLEGRLLSDNRPKPPYLKFNEGDKYPMVVRKNIEEVLRYYEM